MSDVTSQLRSKCPEKANEKRKVVRLPGFSNYAGFLHLWMTCLFVEEDVLVAKNDPEENASHDCKPSCKKL